MSELPSCLGLILKFIILCWVSGLILCQGPHPEVILDRAHNKPATQSSTEGSHVASKAVTWSALARCPDVTWVSSTRKEKDPVWMVDLQGHFFVRNVGIKHRTTGRFAILVGHKSVSPKDVPLHYRMCATYNVSSPCSYMHVGCHADGTYLAIRGVLPYTRVSLYNVAVRGICSHGYHGLNCTKPCSSACAKRAPICNRRSGRCVACQDGFHGDQCQTRAPEAAVAANIETIACPFGCNHGRCNLSSKRCYECKPGWYSLNCDTKCPPNCLNDTCRRVSGTCNNCIAGYFGDRCQHRCADTCAGLKKSCDQVTGACVSCDNGVHEAICNTCPLGCPDNCTRDGICEVCAPGVFGSKCDQICPRNCRHEGLVCDQQTGECFRCRSGYVGLKCNRMYDIKYRLLQLHRRILRTKLQMSLSFVVQGKPKVSNLFKDLFRKRFFDHPH